MAPPPDAAAGDGAPPSLPRRLGLAVRRALRDSEVGIVLLAVLLGAAVGAIAWGMGLAAKLLHGLLYGIDPEQPLSLAAGLAPWRVLLVLAGGGLALHLLNRLLRRPRPIDPIEANALHGGRLPPGDSIAVALQTVLSNGVGGSVGLEAGYAQAGGGLASRLGGRLGLRRADLRVLVGAGAAGAIAAAFNAPITGAFYGFELVIGSYAIPALFPVAACVVTAVTVARLLDGVIYALAVPAPPAVDPALYPLAMAVGLLAGLLGILLMRGVGAAEAGLARLLPHPAIRLMAGGLGVGGLALVSPVALSSGHGVLDFALVGGAGAGALLVLLAVKALASLLSVGSGFRGGLFFASLLLGALVGRLFAAGLGLLDPPGPDPTLMAMAGMSAFGTAVIGAPLAMTFLALEMTGSLQVASLVLAAAAVAGLVVRRLFGYNFASWRFHLRGEAIPSAHDIGWIAALTAGRLMRRDLRLMPATTTLGALRAALPLGAAERVALTDAAGAYAGLVQVAEAHAAELDPEATLATIARHAAEVLWPETGAREAMALFAAAEAEALAVLDPESRQVLGEVTETHLLRRFGEEVERRRKEESGLA